MSSLADLDAAEQDLMLRVSQAYFDVLGAQDTLADDARQQGGDRRAARLGQAQLRGRHRDHHRHPRGAGALRPGDGAGDRRRERPGDQADRPRPAGRPAATSRRGSSPCRWCCRCRRSRSRTTSRAPPRSIPRCGAPCVAFEVAQLETEKARAPAPADGRRGRLGRQRPRPRSSRARLGQTHAASACSSTCRSTPAARSRTGSRRRWSLEERARNDLEAARRGVTQTTRQAYYTLLSGAAQVKALEAAEALEPARAGGDAGRLPRRHPRQRRRAQRPEPAVPDPARPGAGALRRAAGDACGCARRPAS